MLAISDLARHIMYLIISLCAFVYFAANKIYYLFADDTVWLIVLPPFFIVFFGILYMFRQRKLKTSDKKTLKSIRIVDFFTSITIAMVVAFIALMSVWYPKSQNLDREINESTRASLRGIQSGLELYKQAQKHYPKDLKVMVDAGYLPEGFEVDPYGCEWRYHVILDNEKHAVNYRLASLGPDKKPGTEDDIDPPINTKKHAFPKVK